MGYWLLLPIVVKWEAAHQIRVITWGGLEQVSFQFETSLNGMQIANKLEKIKSWNKVQGRDFPLRERKQAAAAAAKGKCLFKNSIFCLFCLIYLFHQTPLWYQTVFACLPCTECDWLLLLCFSSLTVVYLLFISLHSHCLDCAPLFLRLS